MTAEQKRKNVITAIKNLLTHDVKELGDFGRSKIIDAECLKLALDALTHLETLTGDKENEV